MLTCGKRRKKPEKDGTFSGSTGRFQGDSGLATRPHRAAASPRPREAHRWPTARDPAAAANTATPPHTAAHTATGGVRGRRWGLTSGGAGTRRRTRLTGYAANHGPLIAR